MMSKDSSVNGPTAALDSGLAYLVMLVRFHNVAAFASPISSRGRPPIRPCRRLARHHRALVYLSPGLAARAKVKTDKRKVIDYFLSPLKQYQNESLKER